MSLLMIEAYSYLDKSAFCDTTLLEVVQDVKNRLQNHDISVTEITDEMNPVVKKLLASRLNEHEVKQLQQIKAAQM